MITEHNYTELMKNCMKWNTRTMGDRKKRLRYPYYDQQTGSGQRESHTYLRTIDQRYSSTDASTLLEFAVPERWRKRKNQPPSDAIETKMFLRENPVLEAAISQATHQANVHGSSGFSNFESTPEVSNDSFTPNTRSTPKMTLRDDFRDELLLDDDASPDEGGSDEDEWTSKKSKAKRSAAAKANHHHHHHHGGSGGGGGSSHKKKASGGGASGGGGVAGSHATGSSSSTGMGRPARESAHDAAAAAAAAASTADEKRHVCAKCGAKYKSLAGLSYHLAYMHDQPSAHPHQKLLSPNIQISDYCDLCLGSAYLNKNTKRPEDLVTCHDCGRSGHPSCLSFNKNVTVIINRYGWQCIECKSCTICGTSENDDKLLFCDDCDRGYHLYCLQPPLENAPDDEYSCRLCQGEFGASASAPAKRTHF